MVMTVQPANLDPLPALCEVEGSVSLKGRTVILVDDVATTGNTLNECSRVLKRAGAEKVIGIVLARTSGY